MVAGGKLLKINIRNLAIALEVLHRETLKIEGFSLTAREDTGRGHKIALSNIRESGNVIKYGSIGHATGDIAAGEHIHTHDVKTNLKGLEEYTYKPLLNRDKGNGPDPSRGIPTVYGICP